MVELEFNPKLIKLNAIDFDCGIFIFKEDDGVFLLRPIVAGVLQNSLFALTLLFIFLHQLSWIPVVQQAIYMYLLKTQQNWHPLEAKLLSVIAYKENWIQ